MGNGLNLAVVQHQRGFQKCLAVSGRAGMNNMCFFRQLFIDFLNGMDCCSQRTSVVVAVERIQQVTILTYQCNLCCGRTGINSQITVSFVRCKVCGLYMIVSMTFGKCVIVCLIGKKRIQAGYFEFHLDTGRKLL